MSNDSCETTVLEALMEKYDNLVFKVVQMRKTYPVACAATLSKALHKDADLMMKAEIVPNETCQDVYSPKYLDDAKIERLGLNTKLEPFVNKDKELSTEILDIHEALNQIHAAKNKNVQV